jgi:outer membrane protein OmpA-like peptidoglycan-associated protein
MSVWAHDRSGSPEQAAALQAQNKRDFLADSVTAQDIERLLSPDPREGTMGYRPNGRWVNIAQEDLDNCFKSKGSPASSKVEQESLGLKGAPGQAWQGTDRYLDLRWTYGQNRHEMTPKDLEGLKLLAQHIKKSVYAGRHYVIEGHANEDGSPQAANLDASCRRAAYVREQLRMHYQVDTRYVHAVGYGASQPEHQPASNGKNRRVRIRLLAAQ